MRSAPPGSTRSSRETLELAADTLKVPPRDAVLSADDDGVGAEERPKLGSQRRQAVRLDAEQHDVGLADGVQIAGDLRLHLEIPVGADHAEAALAHGLQVRTAREEDDVGAGNGVRRAPM